MASVVCVVLYSQLGHRGSLTQRDLEGGGIKAKRLPLVHTRKYTNE